MKKQSLLILAAAVASSALQAGEPNPEVAKVIDAIRVRRAEKDEARAQQMKQPAQQKTSVQLIGGQNAGRTVIQIQE